jgi:tetratricopeptide (TPR) repeat protein
MFLFSGLIATFVCAQQLTALAKTDTSDPNTALRKLQGTPKAPAGPPEIPGAKALADLETMKKRNNELSVMHFTLLIKKDPKDSVAYAGRGKAYSGLHDFEKAAVDLNKAIELDPKNLEAYTGRAVVRYTKKDYEGSWQDVHKVEELGGAMWPSFLEALKASSAEKAK